VIRYIIAVAAGKGGVGKSFLSVNLARVLRDHGFAVGVLDADLHGPSLALMMPLDQPIRQEGEAFLPGESSGVKVFSLGSLLGEEALIVRAPIVNGILAQFAHKVIWGDLDYLLVDFPPGTGDIPLTLLQEIPFSGSVFITTPQEISLLDVRKTVKMFQQIGVPILGIVENMASVDIQGISFPLFGEGGGAKLAMETSSKFLGSLPLDPRCSMSVDRGEDFFISLPSAPLTRELKKIGQEVQRLLWDLSSSWECRVEEGCARKISLIIQEKEMYVEAFHIQKHCPCVQCRKTTPLVKEDVFVTQVTKVGAYGVQLAFSSGCSKGIFPCSLLERLA